MQPAGARHFFVAVPVRRGDLGDPAHPSYRRPNERIRLDPILYGLLIITFPCGVRECFYRIAERYRGLA